MGVSASGATLEIQLVADVARLKSDMAQMQTVVNNATGGVTQSFTRMSKGAGSAATEMAAAAQTSARAAVAQATGLKSVSAAAHLSTLELRETLVATRELYSGNFTRLPGSLTLLGQSIRDAGGVRAYGAALLSTLGILKTVQNAELAEVAAQKAAIAASVQSRAERAANAVVARQAQVAIAQAELAAAGTAEAEAAAQAALVKALRSVEVASGKAVISQEALAAAEAEAGVAAAEARSASVVSIGTVGTILIGAAIAATGLEGAFKALQATVDDNGTLDRYAQSLVKTKEQLKELEDKVGGFQITWGDVFHGLAKAAGDALGLASIWDAFKEGNKNAFTSALHHAVDWAANTYGIARGTYQSILDIWEKFPAAFGDVFYSAVNKAIEALNRLVKSGTDQLNALIASANKLPFVHLGTVSAPQIAPVANPYAGQGKDLEDALSTNIPKYTNIARARINSGLKTIYDDILTAAEQRIKDGLAKTREKKPKKPNDHGLAEALAELDAEIKGQLNLAKAYLVSDAAALKAIALQKAEEEAIKHKGAVGLFYERELAKEVATGAAEAAKKVAQLRDETSARKAVNDNVAAGTLSYRDMTRAMQDQTAIQPLLVLQSVAQGEAYKIITEVIEQYRKALVAAHAEEDRSQALTELGKINDQHKITAALLNAEINLVAVTADRREEVLKLLQKEVELRQQFPGMTEAEIQQVIKETAAEDELTRHLKQVEAGYDALRQTGEQMIDTLFNVDNWTDPLKMAIDLVKQLEQQFVTMAFANPIKNKLFGENLPTLSSVGGTGGFFKGVAGQGGAASLNAAGATLNTAGATLNTAGIDLTSAGTLWQGVALQIQAAAAQLAAAGATSGGGGGLGGLGGILGLLGGGGVAGAGAAAGGDIAVSGLYDDGLSAIGLAGGGWRDIGGFGGTDNNVLSLNGNPIARVSADERLGVFPRNRGGAANDRGGDTYHNHFHVQDTGDPLKNRQTGMQYAAGFEAGMAARRRKGLAG